MKKRFSRFIWAHCAKTQCDIALKFGSAREIRNQFCIYQTKWKTSKVIKYLLDDRLVIPFFVEFKIEPSRLKLDWRTIFMEFFGGNGGGDGSLNCSIGLCLPQRFIIILTVFSPVFNVIVWSSAHDYSTNMLQLLR